MVWSQNRFLPSKGCTCYFVMLPILCYNLDCYTFKNRVFSMFLTHPWVFNSTLYLLKVVLPFFLCYLLNLHYIWTLWNLVKLNERCIVTSEPTICLKFTTFSRFFFTLISRTAHLTLTIREMLYLWKVIWTKKQLCELWLQRMNDCSG